MRNFNPVLPDHYLIRLTGSIVPEALTAFNGQLQQALQAKSAAVLVDCKQAKFVCTAALRSLLSFQQQFARKHKQLVLFDLQPAVTATFINAGLEVFIPIVFTYDQALRYAAQT